VNTNRASVLLAENRDNSDGSLKSVIEQRNIEVLECIDGIEAINIAYSQNPDLIILDVTLPKLNGYICARILKNDPLLKAIPIIHLGSSQSTIEQYWSKTCGGDLYLQAPLNESHLNEILNRFLRSQSRKRQLLAPVRMVPEMEALSVLGLANNLLEQELLRANILNEINLMDISGMPTDEFVMAVMAIISTLFDFALGAALLIFDPHLELFIYTNEEVDQAHLDEIKTLTSNYLEQHHEIYIDPGQMRQNLFPSNQGRSMGAAIEDLYVHTKESGPIRSVLAFENIGFESLRDDEKEILQLALNLAHGVIEKKVFFQISQEASIIDGVTEGYSLAFFIEYLRREIESAQRNGYPLTLFTLSIPNFEDITRGLKIKLKNDLIRIIQDGILKLLRKSDIVARWETAAFAVLLPHTALDKARVAMERINNYLTKDLSNHQPSTVAFEIETGISPYDPESHRTPETFFSHAQPQKRPAKVPAEDSPKTKKSRNSVAQNG